MQNNLCLRAHNDRVGRLNHAQHKAGRRLWWESIVCLICLHSKHTLPGLASTANLKVSPLSAVPMNI